MTDFDAVIVGGGPAGLAAGAALARAGHHVAVLERELFGGNLQHAAWIRDYPAYPDGISGAQLAAALIEQATSAGATLQQAEMSTLELFSRSRWVACSDGRGFSCSVVILAGGSRFERVGLPNEERLRGRGVIDCTPCDVGFFIGQPVAIYGASEYAIEDASYLASMGVQVTRLEPPVRLDEIVGDERVEGIVVYDPTTDTRETLAVRGVAVRLGLVANSEDVRELLECDAEGKVVTNAHFETSSAYVLACGDLQVGSRSRVASAMEEGKEVAARAAQLLGDLATR